MTPQDDNRTIAHGGDAFTRRRLLEASGAGALTIGFGGLLAACGGDGGNAPDANPDSGAPPQRGGTLRIGATGGGSGDTLDGQNSLTNVDFILAGALYEQLFILNATTGQPENVLAESLEPNGNATEWTLRLREGVTFHDGKPLTAKDALFSLRRIEKNAFPGLSTLGPIDLSGARVLDARTLRIPFDAPYAVLPEGLAGGFTIRMVPEGYDPEQPVGTGPFRYESFAAGERSSFVRNDDYWDEGKPYLDTLEVINFADETAQTNALQSGEVDVVNGLSYTSIAPVQGNGGKVVVSKTAAFVPLTMRVDTAPFDDVRVRQAMRLIINRDELNQQIFGGEGSLGNDVFGAIDAAYEGLLEQREQDVEQARSLLKAAGQSDLRVTLYSSPIASGAEQIASIFATQAKEAGVTVEVVRQQPTQFFEQSYSKVPFGVSFWNPASYIIQSAQGVAQDAPFNEIHQSDPRWDKLYAEAIRTTDEAQRTELVRELIQFDHEEGGYIIPVNYPTIEGMAAGVEGNAENITGLPINGSNGIKDISMQT